MECALTAVRPDGYGWAAKTGQFQRPPRSLLRRSGVVIDDQIALSPDNSAEIAQVEIEAKVAPDVDCAAGMVRGRCVVAAFSPFRDHFYRQVLLPNRPNRPNPILYGFCDLLTFSTGPKSAPQVVRL